MPVPPARRASLTNATPPPVDDMAPYTPATPKSSQSGFFSNAFRRFQSSSGQLPGVGKFVGGGGGGGLCERRVMNVDKSRERPRVQGLDQAKLRRVAFCVDVEVAGNPKYREAEESTGKSKKKMKDKEKKPKGKAEGDAPKLTEQIEKGSGTDDATKHGGEQAGPSGPSKEDANPAEKDVDKPEGTKASDCLDQGRAMKSEDQAVEGGAATDAGARPPDQKSSTTAAADSRRHKSQEQPTTDPLRIYRRCCQLRETNALKKVVEQLSAPKCAVGGTPGTVICLDLCDFWIPLADLITLADWFAVVPVRKLKLENCGLGDEGIRVVLGGLLASRPVGRSQCEKDCSKAEPADAPESVAAKAQGSIEKLSLKNNPKIGRDGWKHISLFLHLCRSIKAVDLSMIPFPPAPAPTQSPASLLKSVSEKMPGPDMASLLSEAISERYAGSHLEELSLSGCALGTGEVEKILKGVSKSGLRRLCLAKNHLAPECIDHVVDFLRNGTCEGLDLGGNDLQESLLRIAEALDDKNPLYALSLADCNLAPPSLALLLPALVSLPSFRFVDLSHNHDLFSTQPDALGLLRKYLPRLRSLRRIHLEDVALSPEHAIALAEVLPENPSLAHLSILENPRLSALASTNDEASQQEACALYASLMAAVRVSKTIISVDVDVPSPDSSEVVKALAKQVVAYCLRNMERGPVAEYDTGASTAVTATADTKAAVAVPDVLLQIVGQADGSHADDDGAEKPSPGEDYVIGGTGVVKALGVFLGNTSTGSRPNEPNEQGEADDEQATTDSSIGKANAKAKEMSKNLLESARKIRARLEPALAKEAKAEDDMSYRRCFDRWGLGCWGMLTLRDWPGRLLFLDQTLQRIIQRFEDEYPETRLAAVDAAPSGDAAAENAAPRGTSAEIPPAGDDDNNHSTFTNLADPILMPISTNEDEPRAIQSGRSRHGSDVSLASRALAMEEGQMHRLGQQVRRGLFGSRSTSPTRAQSQSGNVSPALEPSAATEASTSETSPPPSASICDSDTTDLSSSALPPLAAIPAATAGESGEAASTPEAEQARLISIKRQLEEIGGMEWKERMTRDGPRAVLRQLDISLEELQRVQMLEPELYAAFREAQEMAQRNVVAAASGPVEDESSISQEMAQGKGEHGATSDIPQRTSVATPESSHNGKPSTTAAAAETAATTAKVAGTTEAAPPVAEPR